STRLNSSHVEISYAVFCLTKNQTCARSEEHTSELQSRRDLVCRLLLAKKKRNTPREVTQPPGKFLLRTAARMRGGLGSVGAGSVPLTFETAYARSCTTVSFFLRIRPPPRSTSFPSPALFP